MSKLVAEEYLSSLTDLTVNSKPLINMLTMLADENVDHAPAIVQVIENHIEKVPPEVKLPILYLIDSIIKNVSKVYVPLFTQNIVNIFVSVFEKVDERTRLNMYKLRQTWADVFPARKLYVLDLRVKDIDHAWPVTAPTPTSIHFNPKFLGNKSSSTDVSSGNSTSAPAPNTITNQNSELSESVLGEQLLKKQKILLELQQKKLELQLMQTKAIMEGQENKVDEPGGPPKLQNLVRPLNEEAAKLISQRAASKPKAVLIPPSKNTSSKSSSSPSKQKKTKIAPANSQLIEAAKSRDPRIARHKKYKQDSEKKQQNKVSEVTSKEQEILNRQLAMLKTPIAEQVAPVVPAQKVLGDSSAKSHITFNVQGSLEKVDGKDKKQRKEENLVNVSGKDVDLRLLSVRGGSPNKKRLSPEVPIEEPPKKKNKSEILDELFGSEDVDLRKMPKGALTAADKLPSPPPPPVISNGPPAPQVAAVAPLNPGGDRLPSPPPPPVISNGSTVPQPTVNDNSIPDVQENTPSLLEEPLPEDHVIDNPGRDRDANDSNRSRNRNSWAEIKVKPEAEIKPMPLTSLLEIEVDQRKDHRYPSYDSPDKGGRKRGKDRNSPRGELDRLGRPLLYNKLPNDPRARRESLGVLDGRDTDMRRHGNLMDRDLDTNINVNRIIAQAADQVRDGTMSLHEYNELLTQVIHVNEKQKLREAQNKSRQEMRRSQHHHRGRRSPNRFGHQNRNSPPYRHEDDRRDRRHFNDIDERLPMPWANMPPHNDSGSGFNRGLYLCGPNRPFDISNYDDSSMKSDIWEDEQNRLRRMNEVNESENRFRDVLCNERTHDCVDVPPADPQILDLIAKDPMKSINIDGTARDVRFYGDTAVVMLSWDEPKEISFEDGIRRVLIGDLSIVCALNDPYIMFMLNGKPHRIRLGAPTRELYIDGEFYEAHFGGPPVQVQIDGLPYLVQVEGPPPQVKIGKKRTDLVCGRVNMIVDATAMLPLYLDAKPQRFDLRSRPYIFRLVNYLKTLLVNEVPVDIQFGGGCRQICGYGNLHFLRLSVLPTGIEPGHVQIVNMENYGLPSGTNIFDSKIPSDKNSPPLNNVQQNISVEINPVVPSFDISQQSPTPRPMGGGPLDILTSLMSGVSAPEQAGGYTYQVENKDSQNLNQTTTAPPAAEVAPSNSQPPAVPLLGSKLNINDLFQRLVASGIVPTLSNTQESHKKKENDSVIKPIDFTDPNSLRERQPPIINLLYSGIQCSSCGVRFSPEETVKYSRHLDWHFRQNRREKDAARKGQSRKWYYDVSDWIQFEEIEDLEERAQSWFEAEATNNGEENVEQEEIKSVPAPSGQDFTLCELCRDEFETYYNEEKEEWHLKPCILVQEKYYHPICYEDFQNLPEDSVSADKTLDISTMTKEESSIEIETPEEEKDISEIKEIKEENKESTSNENLKEDPESDSKKVKEESEESLKKETKEITPEEQVNVIEYKNEMEVDESEKDVEKLQEEEDEEEIEVLADVPPEQKKNIIAVDLIEKLDDEDDDDDVIYKRKTPSPIVMIPPEKIKQEPVDDMESPVAVVDQTVTNVVSSIDGNVEMIDAPQVAPSNPSRIKITFNKPLPNEPNTTEKTEVKEVPDSIPEEIDPDPLPLKAKKPRIAEREMTVYLPVVKGTEESGLCSIM